MGIKRHAGIIAEAGRGPEEGSFIPYNVPVYPGALCPETFPLVDE